MKKFLFSTAFVSLLFLYNVDAFSIAVNHVNNNNHRNHKKLVDVTKNDECSKQASLYPLIMNYHKIDVGGKILSYVWVADNSKGMYDHGVKLDGIFNIKSIGTNPNLGVSYGANLQLQVPAIKTKNFLPAVRGYNRGAQLFVDSSYGNFSFGYQEGVESIMKLDASMIGSGDNSVTWVQYTGLLDINPATINYHVFPGLYSESLFNESYSTALVLTVKDRNFINNLPFRISYQSPNFMGVRFGISYSPLGYDKNLFERVSGYHILDLKLPDSGNQPKNVNLDIRGIVPTDKFEFIGGAYDNILSAGLSYDHSFDSIDFQASIVGEYAASDRQKFDNQQYIAYSYVEDLSAFALGTSITYHNIMLAASYGYLGKSGYLSYFSHPTHPVIKEQKPHYSESGYTYYWNIGAKYIYDKASISAYYFQSNKFHYKFCNFDIGLDYNLSISNRSKGQYKIFANYHYFDIQSRKSAIALNGNVMLLGMKYEF
ncbi:porin [Ehrlichia sp. JZT12]